MRSSKHKPENRNVSSIATDIWFIRLEKLNDVSTCSEYKYHILLDTANKKSEHFGIFVNNIWSMLEKT